MAQLMLLIFIDDDIYIEEFPETRRKPFIPEKSTGPREGPGGYQILPMPGCSSWTTSPSWPCRFLPFLTLFMFSCTLPHLSHATLLAFTCVCALLRYLSLLGWDALGAWGGM